MSLEDGQATSSVVEEFLGVEAEEKLQTLNLTPEDFVNLEAPNERLMTVRCANVLWEIKQRAANGEPHRSFNRPLTDQEVEMCLAYGRRVHHDQMDVIRRGSGTRSEKDRKRRQKLYQEEQRILRETFPEDKTPYLVLIHDVDLGFGDTEGARLFRDKSLI